MSERSLSHNDDRLELCGAGNSLDVRLLAFHVLSTASDTMMFLLDLFLSKSGKGKTSHDKWERRAKLTIAALRLLSAWTTWEEAHAGPRVWRSVEYKSAGRSICAQESIDRPEESKEERSGVYFVGIRGYDDANLMTLSQEETTLQAKMTASHHSRWFKSDKGSHVMLSSFVFDYPRKKTYSETLWYCTWMSCRRIICGWDLLVEETTTTKPFHWHWNQACYVLQFNHRRKSNSSPYSTIAERRFSVSVVLYHWLCNTDQSTRAPATSKSSAQIWTMNKCVISKKFPGSFLWSLSTNCTKIQDT